MKISLHVGLLIVALLVCVLLLKPVGAGEDAQKTLNWSNYSWNITNNSSCGGSGFCIAENVNKTPDGDLHLKISKNKSGYWNGAEIMSRENFTFGKYQFWVKYLLNHLDKNVVLGMFTYIPGNKNNTNETDIEFSRWGNQSNWPGSYTVWPNVANVTNDNVSFPIPLNISDETTHRFIWRNNNVSFQSLDGYQGRDNNTKFESHTTPKNYSTYIPKRPERIMITLWLINNIAPSNNQPVEVIIKKFENTSL